MKPCIWLVGLWMVPAVAGAQGLLQESALLMDREAVALMPPEVISQPVVRMATWSGDGRYVLVIRDSLRITPQLIAQAAAQPGQPPPGEISLHVWSTAARRLQELWKAPIGAGAVEKAVWLSGSSSGLALVWEIAGTPPVRRTALLRISASTGSARPLMVISESQSAQLVPSPVAPVALLILMESDTSGRRRPAVCVVRDDAAPKPAVQLSGDKVAGVRWSRAGEAAWIQVLEFTPPAPGAAGPGRALHRPEPLLLSL